MKSLFILSSFFLLAFASDRDVLIQLFQWTKGASWNNPANWNTTTSICSWFGVECDGSGKEIVVALYLQNQHMQGSLPTNFGELSNIQRINFMGNTLSGNLPTSMSNLIQLEALVLSHNSFSGAVPEWIGKLENLKILSLDDNQFTSLPSSLSNLCGLQQLYLGKNKFSDNLPDICGDNMEILDLSENDWKRTYDPTFDTFPNLKVINLNNCNLHYQIPVFAVSSKLEKVYMANNVFSRYDPRLFAYRDNLKVLYMPNNYFNGKDCPFHAQNFTNLETCNLSQCGWLCGLSDWQMRFCHANCILASLEEHTGTPIH